MKINVVVLILVGLVVGTLLICMGVWNWLNRPPDNLLDSSQNCATCGSRCTPIVPFDIARKMGFVRGVWRAIRLAAVLAILVVCLGYWNDRHFWLRLGASFLIGVGGLVFVDFVVVHIQIIMEPIRERRWQRRIDHQTTTSPGE